MIKNKKSKKGPYSPAGKLCIICLKDLDSNNTRAADIKQANYICINCRKARDKQRYVDKKEMIREQQRIYDLNNKLAVIKAYGGVCECCNENILEFLTINAADRKESGGKLYRWLIKNNFPKDNCQLLCFNCHSSKSLFGYCPHNQNLTGVKA